MFRATRLWSIIVGWTGLVGAVSCQSTKEKPTPPAQSAAEAATAATTATATTATATTTAAAVVQLTWDERIERDLAELKRLNESGAISKELYLLRREALKREQQARHLPELATLLATKPWHELETMWQTVGELERRALLKPLEESERKSIYARADGLLKTLTETKSVLDQMKANKELTEAEHLLLYSILGSRLDELAATHADFTCYDRPLADYQTDPSARRERIRVMLADLDAFRVAGAIDDLTYRARKAQLEQQLAVHQQAPRPTGRAAQLLAALAGIKPAEPAAPKRMKPHITCYDI